MFGSRWRIFRIFGIPIGVDASWLIILALITWTLSRYFGGTLPGVPTSDRWLLGLVTAVAFFICVVLHELGHSLVARSVGMNIRGITLFLFGGVAELTDEPPSAKSEFLMAIAGPLVSGILAGLFWFLAAFGDAAGWPRTAVVPLHYLGFINLTILIFNLLPAFPLDGGRVFRSILWGAMGNLRRATQVAALVGRGFGWFLIGLGVLGLISGPEFWMAGIWMALIGLFLSNAASSSYQQVVIRQALAGEPVARFMNRQPITVLPDVDLRTWVEDYVYRYHRKTFPVVTEDGHLVGMIATRALADIPRADWSQHTVNEVMRRDLGPVSIAPSDDALHAMEKMQRSASSRLVAVQDGRLVGIVSLKDLMRFLHLKLDLGDEPPPSYGPREREETHAHT